MRYGNIRFFWKYGKCELCVFHFNVWLSLSFDGWEDGGVPSPNKTAGINLLSAQRCKSSQTAFKFYELIDRKVRENL